MDSFYITLPSNVTTNGRNMTNTAANFVTRLAFPTPLNGNWEVGLTEISYTNSWFNIQKDQEIRLEFENEYNISQLRAGKYETIMELIGELNIIVGSFKDRFENPPSFIVDKRRRRVILANGLHRGKIVGLSLSQELSDLLGFAEILYNESSKEAYGRIVTAQRPYELSAGLHSLYIYTNVVAPSYVGDSYLNLLRVVNIDQKADFGQQVVSTFHNPNYLKVQSNELNVIEIECKDDTGAPFPFHFGRTVITLHFRMKTI